MGVSGRIFSVESMGLVDGPGVRTVVFFQGCALRCAFCHNPESWSLSDGEEVTADDLAKRVLKFRPYFKRSGGGVTASGGEPLLQPEFLTELFSLLKAEGVHTCLDTAGAGKGDYEKILSVTDLILFDVKDTDPARYRDLCGGNIARAEDFLSAVKKANVPVIVRQVVIPGRNDSDDYMRELRAYIAEKIPTAYKVELLPYHLLGAHKYAKLGLAEPLPGVPAMDAERAKELETRFFSDPVPKK